MSTVFAIDSLLSRDQAIFCFELMLQRDHEATLVTLAHKQGGILGTVEFHKVISSFLARKVSDLQGLFSNFWVLPSGAKSLQLPADTTELIIFSRGYIHGLNVPQHIKTSVYVYEWDTYLNPEKISGFQRLFKAYVNDWRLKSLRQYKHIAVSSEYLKNKLGLSHAQVVTPTFKTEDYSFVKDEDHNFMFTHTLVYTYGLTQDQLDLLFSVARDLKHALKIMGPDTHLESLKKKYPEVEFVGDHCEATASMLSHQAKAVCDFSLSAFPARAFGALCNGRPAVVMKNPVYQEYLPEEMTFQLTEWNKENLSSLLQNIESKYLQFDRKVLRRAGLKWNERLFKAKMRHFLDHQ